MKELSIYKSILLETALLSSGAVNAQGVFRPRDLRFFIDIYQEWMDPIPQVEAEQQIQNTQIGRYLDGLVEQGVLQVVLQKQRKEYSLPFRQVAVLLRKVSDRNYSTVPEYALFIFLFLKCYFVPFIEERMQKNSRKGASLLIKLKGLADPGLFVEKQLFFVQDRLKSFEILFSKQSKQVDTLRGRDTVAGVDADGPEWLEDLDEEVDALLTRTKSVKTMIAKGGLERVQWEVEEGYQQRLQLLWKSEVARLAVFREQLEAIR